jgi:hypothetical protein
MTRPNPKLENDSMNKVLRWRLKKYAHQTNHYKTMAV